jgi:hypothetical protein
MNLKAESRSQEPEEEKRKSVKVVLRLFILASEF